MRYREILESCWKGYQQQGMKRKGDRMVPNCVPVSEQELEEDLRKWFREKWVRFNPQGKIMGPCARGSDKEGKPKCLPQAKAQALGKKGRASAAARKRREDPNPERTGAARNVATKKESRQVFEARGGSIRDWKNEEPRKFADALTRRWGAPDEETGTQATWFARDGFKRIIVRDEYILHCCPEPHYDFVYSTIDLHVPKNLVKVLADSSESILLDLLKNEVSARCATLSANAVTLNYVMDVVSGRAKGSRGEYERRIKALYKNRLEPQFDWWPDSTRELRRK
jgi:hypothetical protein